MNCILTIVSEIIKGTFMQETLPPLLAMVVMSAFLRVAGKAAVDLRPLNGATMLAWAGVERLTVAMVLEAIEEAIPPPFVCFFFFWGYRS